MTTSGSTTAWDPQVDLAWLVALARRLAQPGEDADDLAQETWLAAMQAADRPSGSPRAWLAGVLRNLRRMRARTHRRRLERERDVVPPESTTPEEAMAQLETLDALHHALAALDPVDRRLVLGRYATGQSAVQLGEQFELPASTVRTRLMRARERLRHDVQSARGLACFAPWALRPPTAAIGASAAVTGGIAMSTATQIVVGVVGVGAAALLAVAAGRLVAAPQDPPRAATDTATASTPAPRHHVASERAEAQRVKRARVQARRAERLAALAIPRPDGAATPPVSESCEDGCMGTLGLQTALARSIAGCRDLLAPEARGKVKFRAHVIAEPEVGAVIDAVELLDDTVDDDGFTECIVATAGLAELSDPQYAVAESFVFRYTVGTPADPAREFLTAFPDLLEQHPEFAAIVGDGPRTDADATAFARWVDQDPEAQVAFGQWAVDEGIDLARVRVD